MLPQVFGRRADLFVKLAAVSDEVLCCIRKMFWNRRTFLSHDGDCELGIALASWPYSLKKK